MTAEKERTMGHYDSCRGYCNCGRHESEPPSNCGRDHCSKYRSWVRSTGDPKYEALIAKWDKEDLANLKALVANREKQEADRKQQAILAKQREKLKRKALKKLTPAERKALGFEQK